MKMKDHLFHHAECIVFADDRKIITIQENKRTYVSDNSNRKAFIVYRVDDCLVRTGIRCDYLLININERKAFFIELKGQDLIHAIEQIEKTIELLASNLSGYAINARVVLSKANTPDIRDTRLIKLQKKLKILNGNFVKSSKILTEKL